MIVYPRNPEPGLTEIVRVSILDTLTATDLEYELAANRPSFTSYP
jgi:hypothetical protein